MFGMGPAEVFMIRAASGFQRGREFRRHDVVSLDVEHEFVAAELFERQRIVKCRFSSHLEIAAVAARCGMNMVEREQHRRRTRRRSQEGTAGLSQASRVFECFLTRQGIGRAINFGKQPNEGHLKGEIELTYTGQETKK